MEVKKNLAMRISTIISAYNQIELTALHVREIMAGTLVPDEIIVVNDNGNTDLKERLQSLEKNTNIIYAYITEDIAWNYTGARNLGFWISTGDVIVSEDNDNIPNRNLYKAMLVELEEGFTVLSQRRPVISAEQVFSVPMEKWKWGRSVDYHRDSFMVTRMDWLRMKGYDERFAGEYGWCSTDWRRRLLRAGIGMKQCKEYYFTVQERETEVCRCGKNKEERRLSLQCPDCGLMYKKLSFRNYALARKKTHIQPPGAVLNFSYEVQRLN